MTCFGPGLFAFANQKNICQATGVACMASRDRNRKRKLATADDQLAGSVYFGPDTPSDSVQAAEAPASCSPIPAGLARVPFEGHVVADQIAPDKVAVTHLMSAEQHVFKVLGEWDLVFDEDEAAFVTCPLVAESDVEGDENVGPEPILLQDHFMTRFLRDAAGTYYIEFNRGKAPGGLLFFLTPMGLIGGRVRVFCRLKKGESIRTN